MKVIIFLIVFQRTLANYIDSNYKGDFSIKNDFYLLRSQSRKHKNL